MKTLFKKLISTNDSYAPLILRLVLGIILIAHGSQLMFGWFGGSGFKASMQFLTSGAGLPVLIAFMVIFLQFFGGLFIIAGFSTRLFAIGELLMFLGMIITVHFEHGFFMNWFGTNEGEGFEYHVLVIGISAALMVLGGGNYSLDKGLQQSLTR